MFLPLPLLIIKEMLTNEKFLNMDISNVYGNVLDT